MATEQAHQTVYWHGDGAWDKESGSSVRRMRSKVRVQVTSLPECVVEEYQNGAWVQIEAPTAFNAEAGWSWQAHQRTLRGKKWMVFHGARPMEDRFLKQTGNPVLYNLMGEALPQGDLALYDFMLPWEDARIWAGAVGALGGAIKRPQADITHAAVLVRDLEKATQDMQDIVDECEQALEKAVSGTMLHLNQLDEYDEQAWQLYDQAAQIFQSIDQELDILNTLGVSTEELAKTMVSREDAEVSHQKIRMLFRQYQQQRLRAGELLQPRKETRGEAGVGKQQLLQALALHLARGGTASNYKGDKLHIPLPQGVLEIGDQVSLKPKD